MLDVAVGNYLDSVTEREFDPALLALLRSQDFDDVHLIHGQFEFGKDAIAKRGDPRTQYTIQSKAGNIGLPEWASMRGQLDMLRLNELAHPSFDRSLPRVGVLVLTGRLIGGAPLDAQEYQRAASESDEPPLEIWDRERLIELLVLSPEAGLAGVAEILGLYGLGLEGGEERDAVSAWLAQFLDSHPGVSRPLSDRWAVSLLSPLLLIGPEASATREAVLRGVVRWLGDRYENDGLGLAASDATPEVEVEYVLGSSLEHVSQQRLGTSYLAAVVLDLAAALELPDVYDVAFNDFEAVGIHPAVPIPDDDVGQYLMTGPVPLDTAPRYVDHWSEGSEWRMAPHHEDDLNRYFLGRLDLLWDHLAVSLVTRDRHWVAGLRAIARPT